ncbi:Gfo/Idh/MocA family protein [Pseudarthrobacter sp. NBSH8]|uniref:Gfo/Idh/MocA family protein n=1 Tax=Pseudarthrobacter sp. NBSH8 TaxID=2596911 RepID=UPI00351B72AC
MVVGIASGTEEKAREYADRHGVPQAFGSYGALLGSPDIDAVYISLPNALHLEWILKSLDVEKLQELLAAGAVGTLTFVHVAHSFDAGGDDNIRWYAGLGGGALFDAGCNCVNMSRMVAGHEPAHVAAFGNYRDANDDGRIDTSIAGMLRFAGGGNHFVRTGERFAGSVLNGTPLSYDLTDAANNARVLEALDQAARNQEGSV